MKAALGWILGIYAVLNLFYSNENAADATCADPLSCVLDGIYIPLPNATIPLTGNAVLYLTNLYCNEVSIQSYPSVYIPPTSIGLSINGMHVYCQGHYVYDTGRIISYQGLMEAVIKNTNVTMDFFLEKPEGSEFADAMSIPDCEFTSMVVDVEFLGNKGVDFSSLAAAVQALLEGVLKQIVCVSLPKIVAVNGTYALVNTINPALENIISNGPSTIPPLDFDYISWSDTVLGLMSKVVDIQLATTIHSCVTELFPSYVAMPWIDVLITSMTNSTGVIDVEINKTIPVRNGTFTVDEVKLEGLNSFKTINLIQTSPTSNISLTTTLMLDELSIILNTTTKSRPEEGYVEQRQFRFAISNVTVDLDLALGINKTHVDLMYYDQFLDPGCILQSIGYFNITSLVAQLTIDEIALVQVSGGAAMLEQNLVELIDNGFLLVTDGFSELVTDTLAGIFQGPVRAAINKKITETIIVGKETATCASHVPYDNSTTVDYVMWYNSSVIKLLDKVVSDAAGINKLMSCITNHTGSLYIDRNYWSIEVDGLNSFYNLSLLSPYPNASPTFHPYNLINSLGFGYCPSKDNCNKFALKFVAKAGTSSWYDPLWMKSLWGQEEAAADLLTEVLMSLIIPEGVGSYSAPSRPLIPAGTSIYLSMENFYLYLDLLAQMNKQVLADVQISQKGTTGCFAQSFQDIAVQNLSITVSNSSLVINDGSKNADLTNLLTKIFAVLTRPSRIESVNSKISAELSNAAVACQNGGVVPFTDDVIIDDAKKSPWEWQLTLLICGCVGALVGLLSVYYYWGRTGKIRCLRPQKGVDSYPVDENGNRIIDERSIYDRWGFKDALICQVKLPRLLRVGIVVAVIGNMGCFLVSNLDPNAVLVMAEVDIVDAVLAPPPVFAFGLKSTVQEMWDAKVYALSVLIAFFSGAWPYIKLAVMGVCWVAPSEVLSIQKREEWLRLMDILGKWSLIDFFVMVMMMCAFMFNMVLGDNLTVNVTVVPKWGFYGFLLATLISLGLGHIILACHRLIIEPKVPAIPNALAAKESLFMHVFKVSARLMPEGTIAFSNHAPNRNSERSSLSHNIEFEKGAQPVHGPSPAHEATFGNSGVVFVKATNAARIVTFIFLAFSMIILYFGTSLNTFTFHFKGLTGVLLKSEANVNYSFVSVGTAVPTASGEPNDFSVRWMEACYFAFGIAMPLAFLIVISVMWFFPLSLSRQRLLLVIAEVLNAWSALDVFCISIAAALVEIQQFAAFIVGDKCDGINQLLVAIDQKIDYDGEGKCFDVIATLKSESWTIFLAAGMLIIVGIPSLSIATWVVKDRIEQTILFHNNSWASNLNRAADLLSASEKSGMQISPELRNPLMPAELINEPFDNSVSASVNAVTFDVPNPASVDKEQGGMKVSDAPEPLTTMERFQSMLLLGLVKCNFIIVVDPSDVRGLEAIGMGVANTFSQSLHASGNSLSFNSSATEPSAISSAYEPPVYTGDNDYEASVTRIPVPSSTPIV